MRSVECRSRGSPPAPDGKARRAVGEIPAPRADNQGEIPAAARAGAGASSSRSRAHAYICTAADVYVYAGAGKQTVRRRAPGRARLSRRPWPRDNACPARVYHADANTISLPSPTDVTPIINYRTSIPKKFKVVFGLRVAPPIVASDIHIRLDCNQGFAMPPRR